jgi:hypothetical protein
VVGSFKKVDGGKTSRQLCFWEPPLRGALGIIEKAAKLLHLLGRRFGLTLLTNETESEGVVHVGTKTFSTLLFGRSVDQKFIADQENEVDRKPTIKTNFHSAMAPRWVSGYPTERGPPGIFYHLLPPKQFVCTPQLTQRAVSHFPRNSRGVAPAHGEPAVKVPHPSYGVYASKVHFLSPGRVGKLWKYFEIPAITVQLLAYKRAIMSQDWIRKVGSCPPVQEF